MLKKCQDSAMGVITSQILRRLAELEPLKKGRGAKGFGVVQN